MSDRYKPKGYYQDDDEDQVKSRTQVKREAEALQVLGSKLVELSKSQLLKIPMDVKLTEAVHEANNIKHREGLRRHLQYIGKLMRSNDHEAITEAYERVKGEGQDNAKALQLSELWRDRLIQDPKNIAKFITEFPSDDIQLLRQLVRNAQKEISLQKPPTSSRKLFRFLREAIERQLGQ